MNAPLPPRVPPRFVPVLTEVVHGDTGAPLPLRPSADAVAPPWGDAIAPATPGVVVSQAATPPAALPATTPATPPAFDALDDQLIHRVMQRVDVALERNLHDAVASMVLQHTQSLVPRLREEIEFVVRQAVAEAVAAELAQRRAT